MLLKLAAGMWPPVSSVTSIHLNGKNMTLLDNKSFMGEIVNELANKLNFSYEIVNHDVNIGWGILDPSLDEIRFNGMVGMIQRDEVDLGVGPFSINYGNRYLVSNPSTIIMESDFLLLSSGKNFLADQTHLLTPLMKSFETWVWILSLIAIISVSIIKSAIDLLFNNNNKIELMKLIETNLFFHQRNILRQDTKLTANQFLSHKIIDISWLLPSFLLSLFYSSMILAQLLATSDKPIDSLNDLANAQDTMLIVEKNSIDETFIKKGQSDDIKRIYSRIKNKFGEKNCFVSGNEKISDHSLSEILAGRRVFLESIISIKNLLSNRVKQTNSCGFHIGSTLGSDGYSMLFNKQFNATLRRKIDKKLLIIFECKPFDIIINRGNGLYSLCLEKNNIANISYENKSLSISNILALIVVCSIIIGLSLIILIFENLLSCLHPNLKFPKRKTSRIETHKPSN